MGEYLSPIIEGFSSPTMDSVYNNIFNDQSNLGFLESLLQQQKNLAISLMASTKILLPRSQKKKNSSVAYDAAFESDITAPLPNASGTLQGFTLFFFILSYFSLAIVFSININQLTGNTMYAVYSFLAFIFMFIVSISLITRFG